MIVVGTFSPASSSALRKSASVPPFDRYRSMSSCHSSIATYPAALATRIFSSSGVGRIVLEFRQYRKSATSHPPGADGFPARSLESQRLCLRQIVQAAQPEELQKPQGRAIANILPAVASAL